MQVHISGRGNDNTGLQLEQLTTIILEREVYTGCNCNKITYGGGKIDVCASKSNPKLNMILLVPMKSFIISSVNNIIIITPYIG